MMQIFISKNLTYAKRLARFFLIYACVFTPFANASALDSEENSNSYVIYPLKFGNAPCFYPKQYMERLKKLSRTRRSSKGAVTVSLGSFPKLALGEYKFIDNNSNAESSAEYTNLKYGIDFKISSILGVESGVSDLMRAHEDGIISTYWLIFWNKTGGVKVVFDIKNKSGASHLISAHTRVAALPESRCR